MEYEYILVKKLNAVDHDLNRLSDVEYAEVFALARAARIELPRAGQIWPSSPGADLHGGAITPIEPRPR